MGTRITCNTVNDVYWVHDRIKAVAQSTDDHRTLLILHDDFQDDYIRQPKDSGYRALSLLVGVRVAIGSRTEPVTCEVQMRTLLQHAWGELTHEDTYKPEMKVPTLIVMLSKRLANTLAVLDEIAQDIRTELDKLESAPLASELAQDPGPTASRSTLIDGADNSLPAKEEPSGAPADPGEDPFAEELAPLSWQDVETAYHSVFNEDALIEEAERQRILSEFAVNGASVRADLERAFQALQSRIGELKERYSLVLTAFGRAKSAPLFLRDQDAGMEAVRELFEQGAKRERFLKSYACRKGILRNGGMRVVKLRPGSAAGGRHGNTPRESDEEGTVGFRRCATVGHCRRDSEGSN